ncbi:MAG: DinB family protein [Gemmatimonadales bacterium]
MLIDSVRTLILRDLALLRREVEAYPIEGQLWAQPPGIPNAAGTLALHCAGNLRHYVGARLGGTDYLRDRPAEFNRRDVPRKEILAEIDAAAADVGSALERLTEVDLTLDFPEVVGGVRVATGEFLVHLAGHLLYHVGQIDYHRRVVTGDAKGLGAVRVADLGGAHPAGE